MEPRNATPGKWSDAPDERLGTVSEAAVGDDCSRGSSVATGWAMIGVSILFASATYRMGSRGIATMQGGLSAGEWVALVLLTLAFVYGEGFRALDRRWVPGLVQRARRLRREGGTLLRVLAPLYGLSLIGVDRRKLVRAWAGTTAIVLAVLLVRSLPEPWRGITDFAVAAALAWGLVAILRRVPSALE